MRHSERTTVRAGGAPSPAITPMGFSCFRLVPLGPETTDGEVPYAPVRLMSTRAAMGAFMQPRLP